MSKPGPGKRPKPDKQTMKRLLSYITAKYKLQFLFVLVCIIISAVAGVSSSIFIRILIDDYITPMLTQANPVFTGLAKAVFIMCGIFVAGILATYTYNRMMVVIAQGVLIQILMAIS